MPHRNKKIPRGNRLFISGGYPAESMVLVGNNIPVTGGLLNPTLIKDLKKR
jgi:hypothetical protein